MDLNKRAFKDFYEVYRIPDIGEYVKRVISSCENSRQSEAALKWGIHVICTHINMITKKQDLRNTLMLLRREKEICKDIRKHYEEHSRV